MCFVEPCMLLPTSFLLAICLFVDVVGEILVLCMYMYNL